MCPVFPEPHAVALRMQPLQIINRKRGLCRCAGGLLAVGQYVHVISSLLAHSVYRLWGASTQQHVLLYMYI